jgi:hypothetical protein
MQLNGSNPTPTQAPKSTPSQEPMLLASARTGGGLTHLKDLTVYEGSRPVGIVRLFKDVSSGKVWAYGQDNSGRAQRYDVSGKSENQIRYGSYKLLSLYPLQYNMDDIARGVGLLSGSRPEKAKDVGYEKIGTGLAKGANDVVKNLSKMSGRSIEPVLTFDADNPAKVLQSIERNVLPRYGASSIGQVLASRRFYADPSLAKHVEDASRSYTRADLSFAQVLDGARPNMGLGTHWMQLQHQSQGRGYVDEQVGLLHNTLQAYMQGQASRQQLNAAVAQFRSNIDGRRLADVLTPAQIRTLASANYELSPATRIEAKYVGTTITVNGQPRKVIGEVHLKTKVERNGQLSIVGASLERVDYDAPGTLDGKGHKTLGANSINVGISNGFHGKPVRAPLSTWKDIELVTRDALQNRLGEALVADRRTGPGGRVAPLKPVTIDQGLPKILLQVLPDGGGPVRRQQVCPRHVARHRRYRVDGAVRFRRVDQRRRRGNRRQQRQAADPCGA